MKILLVEDNINIAKGLIYSLEQNGYDVVHKTTVASSKAIIKYEKFDLIILDIMLPDGNGFELYNYMKEKEPTKVIFLTAKDDENDVVNGLELGAEDYITKPFSTRELLARIKRILNKAQNIINVKDITLDMDKLAVYKGEEKISLTSLEMRILILLFSNLNKVVKREYIIDKIWEWTGNDVNDNTVTVYMKRIREKLNTDIIVTIKGIGYRVDGDEK